MTTISAISAPRPMASGSDLLPGGFAAASQYWDATTGSGSKRNRAIIDYHNNEGLESRAGPRGASKRSAFNTTVARLAHVGPLALGGRIYNHVSQQNERL